MLYNIVPPTARLIGITSWVDPDGNVRPWPETSPDCVNEEAMRTCYKTEDLMKPGTSGRMIRKLLTADGDGVKHEAVIEQCVATIKFRTDRGVSHELVRHRIASYAQESTRYCNYGRDKFGNQITVIEPPTLTEKRRASWSRAVNACAEEYFNMLEDGAKPQEARSVLPNSLKTEIVTTFNFREWRHFFRLRMGKRAHPQIRQIAALAHDMLMRISPVTFEEYQPLADSIIEKGLVLPEQMRTDNPFFLEAHHAV